MGQISRMRAVILGAVCLLSLAQAAGRAAAQGIASATVSGSVRGPGGAGLDGAGVSVLNTATGVAVRTQVRRERFTVRGLEPGGPYVVEVRHIGFLPRRSRPFRLGLGEPVELAFVLEPAALRL
jgi:carboxypeptidase family protein